MQLATLVYWTFGNLGSTGWDDLGGMGIVVAALIVYCCFHRWDYNALLSGSETAVTSVIVANVGLISFIGLVAPHIVRMVVGNNHIYVIPGSILTGATILLLSDLFARVVISPVILPIGAITSFLGGPLFLYLLFKEGKRE